MRHKKPYVRRMYKKYNGCHAVLIAEVLHSMPECASIILLIVRSLGRVRPGITLGFSMERSALKNSKNLTFWPKSEQITFFDYRSDACIWATSCTCVSPVGQHEASSLKLGHNGQLNFGALADFCLKISRVANFRAVAFSRSKCQRGKRARTTRPYASKASSNFAFFSLIYREHELPNFPE